MTENSSDKPGQWPGADFSPGDEVEGTPPKTSSGNLALGLVFVVLVAAVGLTAAFTMRLGDSLRETASSRWPADESPVDGADGPMAKDKPSAGEAGASEGSEAGPAADQAETQRAPKAGAGSTPATSSRARVSSGLPVPKALDKTIDSFNWPTSISGYQLQASSGGSSVTYMSPNGSGTAAVIYVGGAISDEEVIEVLGGAGQHSVVVDNQVICTQASAALTCLVRTVSHTFVGQADSDANPVAVARLLSSIVAAA